MTAGLVVGAAAGCTGGGVPSAGGARIANGTPFTLTIERRYQGAWLGLLMLDPGTTGSIALQGGECRSDLVAITGVLVVVARHPTPLCAGDTWAIDSAASPEATLEP